MVLGMDWLTKHSPMQCDWVARSIQFPYQGDLITLQGIQSTPFSAVTEASVHQVVKWTQGNDIWAMAVLEPDFSKGSPPVELAVQSVLDKFSSVFTATNSLPPHRVLDHSIALIPNSVPVNSRPYRYSPTQKDEIEKQVLEMLNAGLITPSCSPFASPVLLVKKQDNSWRFCVDYRRLNSLTIKNKFPLPIVDELLNELAGTKFFSKLDLRSGYHQIRMLETDEFKTAFKTHHAHFQFRVMPFGLTNAPATFQCLMNSIFAPFLRKFVLVFMDDILIYSRSLEDNIHHIELVLQLLQQHQLCAKLSKCSFPQNKLEYLGHIISAEGVATDPEKTRVMQDWPLPSNVTELRGFLGLTGYYRKFVKHYGILAKPLTMLLQKNAKFVWTPQAQSAFVALKEAMCSTPVLALPDFAKPFVIETDACATGIGVVLSQEGHPVAFYSKALGIVNQRLSIYEKEFLAIMMAVDRWRSYLLRGPFVIKTDHKALCHLDDQTLDTELQKKAMTKLIGLQYKFQYKKGVENKSADALSKVGHFFGIYVVQSVWV